MSRFTTTFSFGRAPRLSSEHTTTGGVSIDNGFYRFLACLEVGLGGRFTRTCSRNCLHITQQQYGGRRVSYVALSTRWEYFACCEPQFAAAAVETLVKEGTESLYKRSGSSVALALEGESRVWHRVSVGVFETSP